MLLEVCAYNVQSCLVAAKAGAGRIELCSNPAEGGVTPSFGLIAYVMEQVPIPAYIMIRPRGGNYLYDAHDLAIMKKDIIRCRELGCEGIATGVQLADKKLNVDVMRHIVDWAGDMEVTCHKVFDETPNAFEALDVLIAAGVRRVLTSGLQKTATEGAPLLKQLVDYAQGRIVIMPGGSVRSANIAALAAATGAAEFHSSAITEHGGQLANEEEVTQLIKELNK